MHVMTQPNKTPENHIDKKSLCMICLDPILDDAFVNKLDCECKYTYIHQTCFNQWYQIHASCPICKHTQHEISLHIQPLEHASLTTKCSLLCAHLCLFSAICIIVYLILFNTHTPNADYSEMNI